MNMTNSDNNISQTLTALIKNGSIPHAVLLEGKFALENAQYLAQTIVCEANSAPCGDCEACMKAKNKAHPDIIYCEPVKSLNPYPIEFVRDCRNEAYIAPNEAKHRVYIFTQFDNIAVPSQNALLKIIEEPPETAVFIFCCKSKDSLLDTIISRVSVVFCGAVDGTAAEEDDADFCADVAEKAVFGSEYDLMMSLARIGRDREKFIRLCDGLKMIFRTVYVAKCGAHEIDCANKAFIDLANKIGKKTTLKSSLKMFDTVCEIQSNIKMNANMQLNLTRATALMKAAVGQ